MELLYGKYNALATGGAIGDVLFFFCSGFTLFLGKMGRFDNWYKRRINRIYPTVFAWKSQCFPGFPPPCRCPRQLPHKFPLRIHIFLLRS